MNALERYIAEHKLDETKAMNALQEHGIISDLCVWARDVADVDCKRATDILVLLLEE